MSQPFYVIQRLFSRTPADAAVNPTTGATDTDTPTPTTHPFRYPVYTLPILLNIFLLLLITWYGLYEYGDTLVHHVSTSQIISGSGSGSDGRDHLQTNVNINTSSGLNHTRSRTERASYDDFDDVYYDDSNDMDEWEDGDFMGDTYMGMRFQDWLLYTLKPSAAKPWPVEETSKWGCRRKVIYTEDPLHPKSKVVIQPNRNPDIPTEPPANTSHAEALASTSTNEPLYHDCIINENTTTTPLLDSPSSPCLYTEYCMGSQMYDIESLSSRLQPLPLMHHMVAWGYRFASNPTLIRYDTQRDSLVNSESTFFLAIQLASNEISRVKTSADGRAEYSPAGYDYTVMHVGMRMKLNAGGYNKSTGIFHNYTLQYDSFEYIPVEGSVPVTRTVDMRLSRHPNMHDIVAYGGLPVFGHGIIPLSRVIEAHEHSHTMYADQPNYDNTSTAAEQWRIVNSRVSVPDQWRLIYERLPWPNGVQVLVPLPSHYSLEKYQYFKYLDKFGNKDPNFQKNWMLAQKAEDPDALYWVTHFSPFTVVRCHDQLAMENGDCRLHHLNYLEDEDCLIPRNSSRWSGSVPLIPLPSHPHILLGSVHYRYKLHEYAETGLGSATPPVPFSDRYEHRLILVDTRSWLPIGYTDAFSFMAHNDGHVDWFEFLSGIELTDTDLLLSFGYNDYQPWLAILPLNQIFRFFHPAFQYQSKHNTNTAAAGVEQTPYDTLMAVKQYYHRLV